MGQNELLPGKLSVKSNSKKDNKKETKNKEMHLWKKIERCTITKQSLRHISVATET